MGDFNMLDIIVGILILLLGIKGVINGFIKEFFGLTGILLGVYIASVYAKDVGSWISANVYTFENASAISLIGFIVLLVGIWILCLILAEIAQKLIQISALGALNRIFGFCFGAAKIFVIFAIIIYAISNIGFIKSSVEKYTQNSYLYPALMATGSAIMKIEIANKEVAPALDEVKEKIENPLGI